MALVRRQHSIVYNLMRIAAKMKAMWIVNVEMGHLGVVHLRQKQLNVFLVIPFDKPIGFV